MGFVTVLGLIFVVLKLTGFIAWSWWWVTCPFWIDILIAAGVVSIWIARTKGSITFGGRKK